MTDLYDLLLRDYDPKLRAALEARGLKWFFQKKDEFDAAVENEREESLLCQQNDLSGKK